MVRTNGRNGWIHQRCDDADVDGEDRPLRQERHRHRRIEEADMVHRDDGVVAGLGDVLQAVDFEPE